MGKQKDSIITILSCNQAMTRREIAELIYGTGADQSRIYASLEALVSDGFVVKYGHKPAYYSINDSISFPPRQETEHNESLCIVSLSNEELDKVYNAVLADPTYGVELSLVHRIFNQRQFQKNIDVDIVALKIALIDVTNSTHLHQYKKQINIQELADLIVNHIKDFDLRVSQRDDTLVEELAKCNGSINLFSFASKYCHYHNTLIYGRDDYAKYDGIVHKCLPLYLEKANIRINGRKVTSNTLNELRKSFDYHTFNDLIDRILCDLSTPIKKSKFDYVMWYYNR